MIDFFRVLRNDRYLTTFSHFLFLSFFYLVFFYLFWVDHLRAWLHEHVITADDDIDDEHVFVN